MYRVSEKEEIKKMLQIGKTPKEYYGIRDDDQPEQAEHLNEEDSSVSETLLK